MFDRLTVNLNGKTIVFDVPDNFDPNTVNTDPPEERLQLEWV